MTARSSFSCAALLFASFVFLAGCSKDDEPVALPEPNTRIFLSAVPITAGEAVGALQTVHSLLGGISVEAVDSINVEFLAIAGIQPGDSVNYAFALPLVTPSLRVNLRSLPANGVDSVEIARGVLNNGTYTSIRLRFVAATITFNTTVTSRGRTFEPGTYPLDMPHGINFAVDVPGAEFVVNKSTKNLAINITFDVASSVSSLTNTDTTNLSMNPIFRR
jgi:hypothetical protein